MIGTKLRSQKPAFVIGLLLLVTTMIGLRLISDAFDYSIHWSDRPNLIGVGLMILAGASYLAIIVALPKAIPIKHSGKIITICGAFLHIIWFNSTPIYEDDYYRYFFDGQMVTNALNPYAHSPADALPSILPATIDADDTAADNSTDTLDPQLQKIAQSGPVNRVAYPYVRTIYPTVTQAFFAISQALSPWNINSWRLILLFMSLISLFLISKLLKTINKSPHYTAVYWLNPLIITETMNAGHMDILLLPFLLSAILFLCKARLALAGGFLAAAVGVKIWPLLLTPLFFVKNIKKPKQLFYTALPFIILSLGFLLPQILTKLDNDAGLVTYSQNWQVNSFIFNWLNTTAEQFIDDPVYISRTIVGFIVIAIIAWQTYKSMVSKEFHNSPHMLTHSILIITASLFLLSPTGYPWYYIWLIPWLCIHPSRPLLLLTVTLPLYDLRYPLSLNENGTEFFDHMIVPIEFIPTLLWLVIDFAKTKITRRKVYD
jgi:hypothetical protein